MTSVIVEISKIWLVTLYVFLRFFRRLLLRKRSYETGNHIYREERYV